MGYNLLMQRRIGLRCCSKGRSGPEKATGVELSDFSFIVLADNKGMVAVDASIDTCQRHP